MILAYLTPLLRVATGLLTVAALAAAAPALASGEGLAERMAHLQRHAHKLQLSVEARNARLAGFYVHEIEEIAGAIAAEIPTYDDQPVGRLTGEILMPAVEALEDAARAGDWEAADAALTGLIGACNACHARTEHGYIKIVPATVNPYNQDFSPAE